MHSTSAVFFPVARVSIPLILGSTNPRASSSLVGKDVIFNFIRRFRVGFMPPTPTRKAIPLHFVRNNQARFEYGKQGRTGSE